MKSEKISELTTNRLSVYLRCLNTLAAAGIKTISSQALAEQFNLNSAQIRKDLGYFGEFGVRGVGYYVADLREHITNILGLDKPASRRHRRRRTSGYGTGELPRFFKIELHRVAFFDNDEEKIGRRVGEDEIAIHNVKKMPLVVKQESIDVMVIAVPARVAQKVLNQIMSAGIKAILNFAPAPLSARLGVKVKTVDLTTSLESLVLFPGAAAVEVTTTRRPKQHLKN